MDVTLRSSIRLAELGELASLGTEANVVGMLYVRLPLCN